MAGFNRVILLGNLTRDPELKYLPSNTPVCEFGLAVNRRWRDKDGANKDDVCFVEVSAFGRQAEVVNQYMTKGKPILIEGRLKYDSWTGQDGTKRSRLSVVAENFQFVGAREGGSPGGNAGGAPYERGAPPAAERPSPVSAPAPGAAAAYGEPEESPPATHEDLPF
jgi:single-strand DNA-binding protein